jgi:hypothetical protein
MRALASKPDLFPPLKLFHLAAVHLRGAAPLRSRLHAYGGVLTGI